MIHTICPIINLRIDATYVNGLHPFLLPAGNAYEEKQRIVNETFIWQVGESSLETIINNPTYVFRAPAEFYENDLNITDYRSITHHVGPWFSELCDMLWFIKDNAVSIVSIFTYDINFEHVTQSLANLHCTNSSGNHEEAHFTHEELDESYNFRNIFPFAHRQNTGSVSGSTASTDSSGNFTLSHGNFTDYDLPRLDRALNFVKHIRQTNYVPLKVIFYLAMIEALITIVTERDSKAKVLLRVPSYLEVDRVAQNSLREDLKNAYEFRNKFTHGQSPTVTEVNLPPRAYRYEDFKALSNSLDSIARRLFRKALLVDIEAFTGTDTDISDFWNNLGLLRN